MSDARESSRFPGSLSSREYPSVASQSVAHDIAAATRIANAERRLFGLFNPVDNGLAPPSVEQRARAEQHAQQLEAQGASSEQHAQQLEAQGDVYLDDPFSEPAPTSNSAPTASYHRETAQERIARDERNGIAPPTPDQQKRLDDFDAAMHIAPQPDRVQPKGDEAWTDDKASAFGGPGKEILPEDAAAQGAIGDCMFLAQIIAEARVNPDAIRHLISERDNGIYEVTLSVRTAHGYTPKKIEVDARFPVANGSEVYERIHERDGREILWPALIEKAWAKYRGSYAELDGLTQAQIELPDDTGFSAVTGKAAGARCAIGSMPAAAFFSTMQQAMASKRGIMVSTGGSSSPAEIALAARLRFELQHAYAIKSIDPQSGKIGLENPHGADEDVDLTYDQLVQLGASFTLAG